MVSSASSQPCPQCGSMYDRGQQYCATCGFPVGNLAQPGTDRFIGRSLPGGYHILDLISVGGMGRVYRAEQSMLGRTVAVKVIHPHLLSDENSALRFMTEARAASQLNHPNSIAVFDFGRTDDGQPYMVMEFLRGKDLAHVAYDDGPLPFARIVDVLRQVLAALAEAHDLGIVHRDLKPENVILEPLRRGGDFVKVLDFGLAKLKADAAAPSNVTSPGIVCGTPDFMAPEQGRGDPIDGRSDLYAVGVMLFQLLTERLPFEADSPTQVVMMHLSVPVPDPREVAPHRNIPATLVDVVRRALEKDASRRFQDAMEFSDALQAALDVTVSAMPASIPSGGPTSLVPGMLTRCGACGSDVPLAKFCCDCGAPLRTPSTPPETRTPPQLPLPLVARETDLAWLEDRREEVSDRLVAARIVGEPGSGKTRLLWELADRLKAHGDVVVRVSPDPYWAEVAFYPLRQAIRELACLSAEDVSAGAFPGADRETRLGLAEIFAKRPVRDTTRGVLERRHARALALRWALRRVVELAAGAPVTLALDDLHRMDGASRDAFGDAVGEPLGAPVLVLAAHVSGFDCGWGADYPARILQGLPESVVTRLLHGSRPSFRVQYDEASSKRLLPLHADQLVRYAMEVGGEPPPRLGDLVAQRVDLLEPSARLALQALAVLGDEVEPRELSSLLPESHQVEVSLRLLTRSGMVSWVDDSISTAHPLIHEIVLAGIPAAARRELHLKALSTLEKRGAPLEARAWHAYHAKDSFQALLLLEQVADLAMQRGDTAAEVLALRRGLEVARMEIARGELDDPLQAMLIFGRKLGVALGRAGDFADADGVLREALDIAGPSGKNRAQVLGALAEVARARHRSEDALGYLDQAIETARQSGAHELVSAFRATRSSWA